MFFLRTNTNEHHSKPNDLNENERKRIPNERTWTEYSNSYTALFGTRAQDPTKNTGSFINISIFQRKFIMITRSILNLNDAFELQPFHRSWWNIQKRKQKQKQKPFLPHQKTRSCINIHSKRILYDTKKLIDSIYVSIIIIIVTNEHRFFFSWNLKQWKFMYRFIS